MTDEFPGEMNGSNADDNQGRDYVPPHGRQPKFVPSRTGHAVSLAGLVERVIEEFHIEFEDDSPALLEADTVTKRRTLLRDVAEYIFGIESVQLELTDKASIIQQAYSELFGYGPLDAFFADPAVTTILLEGEEKIALRRGPGAELKAVEPVFDDWHHMRRVMKRLLRHAAAELRDDIPILEVGLSINGRPTSVKVVVPPYTPEFTADIRVHPAQVVTLDDMVRDGMLPDVVARLLRAVAKSPHGFMVVGDTESGKTTLMTAMLAEIGPSSHMHSVEWTGELRLPEGATQHKVQWPVGDEEGVGFAECVQQVLDEEPNALILDEVRADGAEAIAPLLANEVAPRQMWVVRGASDPKRIRSAMGMLARQAGPHQPEAMVQALYERLPFVVVVKRRPDRLEVMEIAEWQPRADAEYPDYVPLVARGWDSLERTSHPIQHPLEDLQE
ncbi:Flp pilus assembly complex ATPase component TadA [Phototrophicus methaneseepsis]|uniref:Flp pilus assembly complex ATPase component TadA n=1 Tax=Phototrophicus methaneseepsis TaxID=2710758 RepID=A0A7S8E5S7_9CHLR|nr:ATPase, T2SS/T4P/T4SS family [Phototrophicus methaneseepsis]QPC80887.1 Flp pilus assembly complex ATPase component TadA [Phototrophicus methaneseepsis]